MTRSAMWTVALLAACRQAAVVPGGEAAGDSGVADTAFVEFGVRDTVVMPDIPVASPGHLALTTASVANEQYIISGTWDAWAGRCESPSIVQLIARGEGFGFAIAWAPADSASADTTSSDTTAVDSLTVSRAVPDSVPPDSIPGDSLPSDTSTVRNRFPVSPEYRGPFEPGTARMALQLYRDTRGFAFRAQTGSVELAEVGETLSGRVTGAFGETTLQDTLLAAGAFLQIPVRPMGADSCRFIERGRPE